MVRTLTITVGLLIAAPSLADTPVIPACVELALREGYPTDVLTDRQLKMAKLRMQWLRVRHPRDPLVAKCREGIEAVRSVIASSTHH